MNYSDKLKDPRWQRRRLEIMKRDNFSCKCCGDDKSTLHVHHFKYCANPWDSLSADLITLCESCHKFVEEYKKDIRDGKTFSVKNIGSWSDGSMIKFILFDDKIKLEIYDNISKEWTGFNFNGECILDLQLVIKNYLRNVKKTNSNTI